MARLVVLEFPDDRLRTVAKPVESFDTGLSELVENMLETMYDAQGIGLAATQIDRHLRLLVMDISEERDSPRVYINPELTTTEGHQVYEEGCLSVPGIYANVERAEMVRVKAQKPDGSTFEEELHGLGAVCLQHEIDHLEGRLFVDYLSPLKRQMVRKKLEKQRRQSLQEDQAGAAI